jgi:ubiquinone biosynthesis protein
VFGRILLAVLLAVPVTIVSLRLLGVRRGWGKALAAGVIGWSLGALMALSLAGWDWRDDDIFVHTLAIAIPATMGTAVALDLLARPGTLAGRGRAGLVVTPHPLRAVRRRVDVIRRYRELVGLIRQNGFGPLLGSGGRAEAATGPPEVRLRRLLEQAGGVYVKLGQIAAMRPDLLPVEVCDELAKLQNRAAAEPFERMEAVLQAELGGPMGVVFAEFDWEPLASASIGQTYRARLHSGEQVVVKVQRPDIDRVVERDLAALGYLAAVAERRTPLGRSLRSGEIIAEFASSLRNELDFRREATATAEMATALQPGVRVPHIFSEYTTDRVLVQERLEGYTVADAEELHRVSIEDRRALADALLGSALEQIMRVGIFHADPHPGNVFVLRDRTLGLIDFGAVGRLDPIQQGAVTDMMAALVHGDVGLLRDGIERVTEVPEAVSPERLERTIARLMADNARPSGAVDARVLQDLIPILTEFGIRLPSDLVLLGRAVVTLQGTLGVLSPGLSIAAAAVEIAGPTAAQPVADVDGMIRDELIAAVPRLRRLPDRIDRILTLSARGELRLRNVVEEDAGRTFRTLANRALLLSAGAVLMVTSALLLVASDGGPAVSQGTGLFEIFGYGGLLTGSILVLRVVAGVARDGTT